MIKHGCLFLTSFSLCTATSFSCALLHSKSALSARFVSSDILLWSSCTCLLYISSCCFTVLDLRNSWKNIGRNLHKFSLQLLWFSITGVMLWIKKNHEAFKKQKGLSFKKIQYCIKWVYRRCSCDWYACTGTCTL